MNDFIKIKGKKILTLIALTEEEQETGLMGKKWPPPVMSFVYKNSGLRKFWMKNTPSPLDIVFCHKNKIISICYGEPNSTKLVGPEDNCDLVIEFPYGTCHNNGFKVGDYVNLNISDHTIKKYNFLRYYF